MILFAETEVINLDQIHYEILITHRKKSLWQNVGSINTALDRRSKVDVIVEKVKPGIVASDNRGIVILEFMAFVRVFSSGTRRCLLNLLIIVVSRPSSKSVTLRQLARSVMLIPSNVSCPVQFL